MTAYGTDTFSDYQNSQILRNTHKKKYISETSKNVHKPTYNKRNTSCALNIHALMPNLSCVCAGTSKIPDNLFKIIKQTVPLNLFLFGQ